MKINYQNRINYLFLIIIICFIDQISKFFINLYISKLLNKDLLLFTIDFVKNYGAAFNLFSGSRLFLSLVSIISSIILSYLIFRSNSKIIDKYALSFILAGSIGNGIDRIFKGFVIDFIKIKFIDFPVFNIADIAINVGVIFLIISYFKVKS